MPRTYPTQDGDTDTTEIGDQTITGNLTVNYPLKHDFNFVVAEGKVAVRKEDIIIYFYSQGKYNIEAKKEGDKLILRKK